MMAEEILKEAEANASDLEKELARVLSVVAANHGYDGLPRLMYLRMAYAAIRTVIVNVGPSVPPPTK